MKIGIIGVGTMGYQLANNFLKQNLDVGVFDINQDSVARLVKLGATAFETPYLLAENYQYIITNLPNASTVRSVVLGENGLLHAFQKNSMLIEMTSSDPFMTKELHALFQTKSYRIIDAPVSGGVAKAKTGELTIMVGGEKEYFEEVQPLLKCIGENIIHVGEIGAGHIAKALNNLISASTLAVTGEAIALGAKLGLKPSKLLEVINSSTGRSLSSEQKFPNQILNRKFAGGFALDLMVKDLSIAMSLSDREKAAMPVASSAYQLWKQAWLKGDPKLDHTTVINVIEENIGAEIKD